MVWVRSPVYFYKRKDTFYFSRAVPAEVTARHLYKDWFELRPQFQLLCAMNELPKVTETDEAYLRRVRIIPFLRIFSPAEMDRNLQDKLKAEADGILQWCIEGARLYQ